MLSTDGHGAVRHLERAVALSAQLSPSYWHAHALLRLAEGHHRVGQAAEAREALEVARAELSALPDAGMLATLLTEKEERLNGRRRREGFLGEPLSESELRVLRLLVDGRSLREVSKDLFLSLNTVKTHRRTIYRKLGVSTREEAVSRARELEVLPVAGDRITRMKSENAYSPARADGLASLMTTRPGGKSVSRS